MLSTAAVNPDMAPWEDNQVQAGRLLAEINAWVEDIHFYAAISVLTGWDFDQITDILDSAANDFEAIKNNHNSCWRPWSSITPQEERRHRKHLRYYGPGRAPNFIDLVAAFYHAGLFSDQQILEDLGRSMDLDPNVVKALACRITCVAIGAIDRPDGLPTISSFAAKITNPLLSDEAYTKRGGGRCPVCRGDQIEGGDINIEGRSAAQEVRCLECESHWSDLYSLVGYTDLHIGP